MSEKLSHLGSQNCDIHYKNKECNLGLVPTPINTVEKLQHSTEIDSLKTKTVSTNNC